MREVVITDALRSPTGRRGGALSHMHPADLLATVLQATFERAELDPAEVSQVFGGCVSKVGAQGFNISRTAWLTAGLPESVPCTTTDAQCGSSQQAANVAAGMVAAGVVDIAVATGVEVMSLVPIGADVARGLDFGKPIPKSYLAAREYVSQFEAAERIADKWSITREDCDEFGVRSQQLAAEAWDEGRYDSQVVSIASTDPDGNPAEHRRDEGLRETTMKGLRDLKPVARPDGVHTAGSSSQIADGASAVVMMSAERAKALGKTPLASIVDVTLVGVDPVMMLTGPIDATEALFQRNDLSMADIDLVEINEAFASIVLSWQQDLEPDPAVVNPNGGAIAHGHALGNTGTMLLTKAAHEMQRADLDSGLVTMCCGGGLGTGTLLRRA